MVNRHCLSDDDTFFFRKRYGLVELVTVQCNRFLNENVFSIGNRLFHKAKMRVVRRRDINDIDLRIGKHLMEIIVNFSNSIFLRKSSRLLMGPVADRVNILSVFLQCDRHFICNHTASEYSPFDFFHREILLSYLFRPERFFASAVVKPSVVFLFQCFDHMIRILIIRNCNPQFLSHTHQCS